MLLLVVVLDCNNASRSAVFRFIVEEASGTSERLAIHILVELDMVIVRNSLIMLLRERDSRLLLFVEQ